MRMENKYISLSLISLYRKPHNLDKTHGDLDQPHKAD